MTDKRHMYYVLYYNVCVVYILHILNSENSNNVNSHCSVSIFSLLMEGGFVLPV